MRFGIDLGGTKIELIALDADNRIAYRQRVATPSNQYEAILDAIVNLISDAHTALGCTGSLGMGIPGAVSPDHGKVKNANSTCLIGRTIGPDLEARLHQPVRIANDADCFTLSEACDGAAAGYRGVFGVILGTGVGGGVCWNQQLLQGPNAITGEWGHNPLPWPTLADQPAPACYFGKHGCIETWLSGPGFEKHFYRLGKEALSAPEIVKLAQAGHILAARCLDQYLDRLAKSLATVINILDPHVIVLGGGMSNIDALYPGLEQRLQPYVFSDKVNTLIVKAKHGDSSGVRGAAWLWPAVEGATP